jgi:hypothetical protein
MEQIRIKNIDDLCMAILDPRLNDTQRNEILCTTIGSICITETDPNKMVELLKTFWAKWGKEQERPVFIDNIDIDVIP